MGKIITLDQDTVIKIAAGEVVENPASVVKEIVENSIDAEATRIKIDIKKGGVPFIKISDNGFGIEEDDIEKVFMRHSTSKIKNANDIYSIYSLGFRGEALASIAAVSKIELVTRTKNMEYGLSVYAENGEVNHIKKTGAPYGTTVIVKDLFYNTPARFKFLKKDATEAGYISDIIIHLALGNPSISFSLTSNNIAVLRTPGDGNLLNTIASIYGQELVDLIEKIDFNDESIEISGYAGIPIISRSNRKHQSIFVNGRYIKSKLITSAIDEAYKTYLMKNKHAFIVLNIKINPFDIDVNVHPSKMEVKFKNEQEIYKAVYHAVNNAVISVNKVFEINPKSKVITNENKKISDEQTHIKTEFIKTEFTENLFDNYASFDNCYTIKDSFSPKIDYVSDTENLSDINIIGQLFSTYILIQKGDYLYLIDQHAAHERIKYEEIKEKFLNNVPVSQTLIAPIVINLTYDELNALNENKNFFNRLGYEFEEFGPNSVIIRGVPYGSYYENEVEKKTFLDLLDIISTSAAESIDAIAEKIMYRMACKAAIKANMEISRIETIEMLKKLSKLQNPYTCPHGRPTAIKISKGELEKMFKRRA